MQKILIIEDDKTIVDGLADTLLFHDYEVITAGSGKEGLALFQKEKPDLIILDIMLPGGPCGAGMPGMPAVDGFEVCKKIKQWHDEVPIIMLTARSQESDKLLGFELGVDDYVTKPFSIKELVARIGAVLNRSKKNIRKEDIIVVGEAEINFKNFTVTRAGIEYPLSPKEYDILKLLISHPDEMIDRNRVIDVVWGDEYYPSPRTIDNFILKLRSKIETDPKNPEYILTVHGAGYKYRSKPGR